jgi:SPOR domain
MRNLAFLLPFLLFWQWGYSQSVQQDNSTLTKQTPDIFQKINSKQDSDLVDLVNLHIRRNQQGGNMQGFRVEIFFSSELNARQKAQYIKNEFLSAFPTYNVYISYFSPDFKVRVGNFRTRNEAIKAMNEIKGQFPRAFVVPDLIELPKQF